METRCCFSLSVHGCSGVAQFPSSRWPLVPRWLDPAREPTREEAYVDHVLGDATAAVPTDDREVGYQLPP